MFHSLFEFVGRDAFDAVLDELNSAIRILYQDLN